jgi:hypothetical protein
VVAAVDSNHLPPQYAIGERCAEYVRSLGRPQRHAQRYQACFKGPMTIATRPVRPRSQSIVRNASPGKRVRAGRRDQPLGNPVVDVVESVVEFALNELDGGP